MDALQPARAKPRLRLIATPEPTLFDSITRECCLRRVRLLAKAYGLHWLVEQSVFAKPGLDNLPDEELAALLKQMEHARECIAEGVTFEDAGLVRNTARHLDHLPDAEIP